MKILQINTHDRLGGAAQIAWTLFNAYRSLGHDSRFAVGYRQSPDPDVLELRRDLPRGPWTGLWSEIERFAARRPDRFSRRLRGFAHRMSELDRLLDARRGLESFDYPAIRELLGPKGLTPDVVHLHNLHGDYFDLRVLGPLSRKVPVLWTLHDQWAMTGHCAYSIDCDRWKVGCGQCPDLTLYPALTKDGTQTNHRKKRWIYAQSRLFIATPSRWLLSQIASSPLSLACVEMRCIPNGVDLDVFRPGDTIAARRTLGLPEKGKILLFSGYAATQSPFKDFETVKTAFAKYARTLTDKDDEAVLVALGEAREPLVVTPRGRIVFVAYDRDPARVAQYYRACDVYLHAARADTFPNVILEALACGRPVVATDVGGISEQVDALGSHPEPTGVLAPRGDTEALADAISKLLRDTDLYRRLGAQARKTAELRYSLTTQVSAYLAWYGELLGRATKRAAA